MIWLRLDPMQFPKKAASLGWAYRAIEKFGGWTDTKRTGKASWNTIWKGWFKLSERMTGYAIFKKINKSNKRYDQETALTEGGF